MLFAELMVSGGNGREFRNVSKITQAQGKWAGKTMKHVNGDGLQMEMNGFSTFQGF